jgi:hypothetical protein
MRAESHLVPIQVFRTALTQIQYGVDMATTRLTYRAYVALSNDAAANSDLQYHKLQQSHQGQTCKYAFIGFAYGHYASR